MIQVQEKRSVLTKDEDYLKLDVLGLSSLGVQIAGTFVATLQFEGSVDGTTWTAIPLNTMGSGPSATSTTAAGMFVGPIAGIKSVRVRISDYTSGSVTVSMLASAMSLGSNAQIDASGNAKVTQATALAGEDVTNNVLGVQNKPAVSGTYSATAFTNYGAATNASVKASAAQLFAIEAHNENAAIRYLQVYNKASAPTEDSEVPIFSWAIPAGTANNPGVVRIGADFFGPNGYYFATGLAWGISVDPDVFDANAVTAGEHQINGLYV